MNRNNRGEVIFAALQYAKADRQEMADGSVGTKWHKEALADIRAFNRVQKELFGTTKSEFDTHLDDCELEAVSLSDIKTYIEE